MRKQQRPTTSVRWAVVLLTGSCIGISSLANVRLVGAQQPSSISIAVEITDSTNQLASAFRSSFRQLGDVRVVDLSEQPDYVLSGVALCNPNCSDLTDYSVALRLYTPFHRTTSDMLVRLALRGTKPASTQTRDSLSARFWRNLRGYEATLHTAVVSWGRRRYEDGVREFVRDIDSRCFDSVRAMQRASESSDSTAWDQYEAQVRSHNWIC